MSKLIQLSDSDGSVYPIGKFAELLWTNPNPSSAFEPQTVSVNLNGYNFYAVGYRTSINSTTSDLGVHIYNVGGSGRFVTIVGGKLRYRELTGSSSYGVTFENGVLIETYGNVSVSNTYMIPTQIYGIR